MKKLTTLLAAFLTVTTLAQEVQIRGAMRATMRQGQLSGTWTASAGNSRYALGPLEYLRGEVTQWNDTIWVSHVGDHGQLVVKHVESANLPFSAHADVPEWSLVATIKAKNLKDLEAKILALRLDQPTMLRLEGRTVSAVIHAVNLPEGRSVSSPEEAHEGKTSYELGPNEVQILAFYSTSHRSILTHHDTDFHLHLLSRDRHWMGHVDALGRGTYRVWIPRKKP